MDRVPTPRFQLSLLGRFELTGPDGPVDLTSKKLAGLLAFLACTAPEPQSRDKLMTLLWGSHFEAQARQNLRQAFTRLRRVLGEGALIANGETVSLRPSTIASDVGRFETLLRDGSRDALNAAVGLYRDSMLADIAISEEGWSEWLDIQRQRFEGLALDAMVKLGEQELQLGHHEPALKAANRAIAVSNLREDAHRLVMRALAAGGRRADALKHYEHLAVLLKSQLAVEPDAATVSLAAELRKRLPAAQASPAGLHLLHSPLETPPPLPDRPSIAVLPFSNLGGDDNQEYFADGIVEDIITALSRCSSLFVIARNSSFTYKGKAVDVRQVGRELGVRYILEGSVRRDGTRLRITGQLIDATSGAHIWADRFDGDACEVFKLQDRVTDSVAAAIEPSLQAAELGRLKQKPAANLNAYELLLRAQAHEYTEEGFTEAICCLQQALAIDSSYAPALAMAAYSYAVRRQQGWASNFDVETAEGLRLATRAVDLGKDDANVLWMASLAIRVLGADSQRARELVMRSLQLNPNSAMALTVAVWAELFVGNPVQALEFGRRAERLNPRDPKAWVRDSAVAQAYMATGQFEEAVKCAKRALAQNPRFPGTLRVLAASLAKLGRTDEAATAMRQLLNEEPQLTLAKMHHRLRHMDKKVLLGYLEGLRAAGLPE
jgi:TolB-like protein/DNA-binding SARP family transcriptional activator